MIPRIAPRLLTVIAISVTCLCQIHAGVISLNFVRGSSGESPLSATDIAGAEPVGNWNNSTTLNANLEEVGITLNDATGAATTAVATWMSGSASWSVALSGAGAPSDLLMMTGYLDQGGDGAGQIHSVTIANVPYASYDVYVYHSSSGGANRTARYNANGVDIYTRNLEPAGVFDGFIQAGYATLASGGGSAGRCLSAARHQRWHLHGRQG